MAQQDKSKPQQKKVTPVLVLEWLDRRPSGYEQEGSRDAGRPIFLDTASQQFLLINSVIVGDDGSLVPIRYIRNAKSILKEEQDRVGLKPNPMNDYIVFEHGVLTVRREGSDMALYDYLKACSFNKNAEKRSEGVTPLFYEINTEVEAEQEQEQLDELVESLAMLKELRSKATGGKLKYNEERIDALVALFNIVNVDTYAEKFNALISLASSRPGYYKKMVGDSTSSIQVAIAQGRELGVISLDGEGASVVDTGRVFLKFNSKKVDDRVAELVNHYLSKEGGRDYKELITRTDAAKQLLLDKQ